ncbi:class I SAM-dependent methyltransferase [Thermodesulfobacteriota bacterium B35]
MRDHTARVRKSGASIDRAASVDLHGLEKGYDGIMYNALLDEYVGHSDFFNYGYWEETTKNQQEASENLVRQLLAFLPERSGSILDVACGKGASTRYLLRHYPPEAITAINISERQLETARRNAPGCSFHRMNATNLAFPDRSFDTVLCVEAAFHFDTRERFFQEAWRVLKPGGMLVLSDILMHLDAERRRAFRTEKNHVRDLEEYRQVMQRSGFRDVQVIDATVRCWHGHYWSVVRFFHQRFLAGELDYPGLQRCLDRTYKVVPDLDYYILAAGRRG